MPELPQYESRAADRGLTPNNIGMEAEAQAGRRIGAFYHQMGQDIGGTIKELGDQWEEHVTFQQISNGMSVDAQNYNASLQAFAQTLKDPSIDKADPSLVPTAVQQFKASQDKLAASFTTTKAKEWYLTHSAQQLDQFQKTIIGQTSKYAGLAAFQKNESVVGAYAQTGYADPTQVPHLLDQLETSHTAMAATATIDAETGARLSEMTKEDGARIAQSGAYGAIYGAANKAALAGTTDPEAIKTSVRAAMDSYLGSDPRMAELLGEKTEALYSKADEVARSAAYDARANAAATEKADHDKWQATAAEVVAKGYQPDGSWVAPPDYFTNVQKLAQMKGADLAYVDTLMNRGESALRARIDNTYVQSDPGVYANFTSRLGIPPGQPGALTKEQVVAAQARHMLSDHDGREFIEGIDHVASDPGRAQAWSQANKVVESFKSSFTKSSPLSGVVDFSGDQAYGRFQQAVYSLWQAELRTKPAAEAEQDMTNPTSPNYIGRLVSKLVPTAADHQRDIQKWAGPGGNPSTGAPNPLAMP